MKEGEVTATIYGLIRDQRYSETVELLKAIVETYGKSLPAFSLLGYCYYQLQDFSNAADCYEELTVMDPDVENYRLYYAQTLYKTGYHDYAMKVLCQNDTSSQPQKISRLKACIRFSQNDLAGAKQMIDEDFQDDSDNLVNMGCLLFKEGQYEAALRKFLQAQRLGGDMPLLAYNIALCYYMMKHFNQALDFVSSIISKGMVEYSELSVWMNLEGIEHSVGNTWTLSESALIEAFNLKAAIEFQLKHYEEAKMALMDMPPRTEEELDSVTLHNLALVSMESNPMEGFQKLHYLLQQDSFPPETFANLLLLYISYGYEERAADVLAENCHLHDEYLSEYLFKFLEAVIMRQTSPEEAYHRLNGLASDFTTKLRKISKMVKDLWQNHSDKEAKEAVLEYDRVVEKYIPVLMQQASIYWERENYSQVRQILEQARETVEDHDMWKLNLAHVFFMEHRKSEDMFCLAISLYEQLVKKNFDNILSMTAVALANLCVSYVLIQHNEEAEILMRKVEKEEELSAYVQPDKKLFHHCIINLAIGTLYCSKGNYEFGISLVVKCLQKKLDTDTWYYAKRCFLSLVENTAKRLIAPPDELLYQCLVFLEHCEVHGHDIIAQREAPLDQHRLHPGQNTVTYEARLMKALIMKLMEL